MRLDGAYVRVRERRGRRSSSSGARRSSGSRRRRASASGWTSCAASTRTTGARLGGLAWRDFGEIERALAREGVPARAGSTASGRRSTPDGARPRAAHSPCTRSRRRPTAILDGGEQRLLLRAAARRFALERARRAARRRGARAARRAAARVRARDRRRGAGPDADAAPDGRAAGDRRSLTLLGDIAQATGPVVHRRWEDVLAALPTAARRQIEELRHAYRVPAEIMDARAAAARRDRARAWRRRSPSGRAARRRASSASRGRARRRARCARRSRSPREDGLLAVIVPRRSSRPTSQRRSAYDDGDPAALAARREGPRVRPRGRRRAGADRARARPACASSTSR